MPHPGSGWTEPGGTAIRYMGIQVGIEHRRLGSYRGLKPSLDVLPEAAEARFIDPDHALVSAEGTGDSSVVFRGSERQSKG